MSNTFQNNKKLQPGSGIFFYTTPFKLALEAATKKTSGTVLRHLCNEKPRKTHAGSLTLLKNTILLLTMVCYTYLVAFLHNGELFSLLYTFSFGTANAAFKCIRWLTHTAVEESYWHNTLLEQFCAVSDYYAKVFNITQKQATIRHPLKLSVC